MSRPHVIQPYLDLLKDVYENGVDLSDRTGTGRRKVFGRQLRFKMEDGFPLDTTRPVPYASFIKEMLWFIKGSNLISELGAKIWDLWAVTPENFEAFMNKYPDLDQDAREFMVREMLPVVNGTVGNIYGPAWRSTPSHFYNYFFPEVTEESFAPDRLERVREAYERGHFVDEDGQEVPYEKYLQMAFYEEVDQLNELITNLKKRPYSSRHIITSWIPSFIPFEDLLPEDNVIIGKGALAPCHVLQQYLVLPPKEEGGKPRLSLQMYQRSLDIGPGGAFNLAQYSLLLSMIAQVLDMEPYEFIWTIGDAHIYLNQLDQVKEHISRTPTKAPTLKLNPDVKSIFDFKFEDIVISDYEPVRPGINYPISK